MHLKKTYVLDTGVLLRSPDALCAFEDNDLVIPHVVLDDLARVARGRDATSETAVHARTALSKLAALRKRGALTDGVPLDNGGQLTVWVDLDDDNDRRDRVMITCCHDVAYDKKDNNTNSPTVLVTCDLALTVRAETNGITVETLRADDAGLDDYTGVAELYADAADFDKFANTGVLDAEKLFTVNQETGDRCHVTDVDPNLFVTLMNASVGEKCTLLGRINTNADALQRLHYPNATPFGVTPRNAAQRFILDALLDPVDTLPLVVIKGPAGTAKTFLSLAVGLERVYEGTGPDKFRRILACRPNVMLDGDEHGFLPGTEREKIEPLMRPVWDNLEALLDSRHEATEKELADRVSELVDRGVIDTQAVGYLRGRSIERTWIIVDESQNLGPETARALISRAGVGSKIILCGDPQQVDSPYLTASANALASAAANMRKSALCAVITTTEADVVRSKLAKDAVRYFTPLGVR